MQSEFGLIKIGRSVNVESRRINLQTTERCKMALVEVYEGCGNMEEELHIDMDDYRLAGEWFDGSDEAREALTKLMGADDPPIEWPYIYDRKGAAEWLDHINVVRHAAAIRRELYREISILRSAEKPSWVYDSGIFYAKWRAETGRRPGLASMKIDGETATEWFDTESDANGIVPAFTASTQNALLAWPEDLRPEQWVGSAIECCIAALTAIRARLPRVERVRFSKPDSCNQGDNR
jgi:Meiotically up-regulated gene 113